MIYDRPHKVLTEADFEIFNVVKDIQNDYEAIIKANVLSNYKADNIIALLVLRKRNLKYKSKTSAPVNFTTFSIEKSWKNKGNHEVFSKYKSFIFEETGFDSDYKIKPSDLKNRRLIKQKDRDETALYVGKILNVDEFCRFCLYHRQTTPTIEQFIETIVTIKTIQENIRKGLGYNTAITTNCVIPQYYYAMYGGCVFFKDHSKIGSSKFLLKDINIGIFEYEVLDAIYEDLNQLYDLEKVRAEIDLKFEEIEEPVEEEIPDEIDLFQEKSSDIQPDCDNINHKQIPRNPAWKYSWIIDMPISVVEKCRLPEFAGIYILRDEDYRRYVGQGKSVIREALSKFNPSTNSLVAIAAQEGKKFWLEDLISGYEDGRPLNLNELEAECIDYYKSHISQGGYNRTEGNKNATMFNGKQ